MSLRKIIAFTMTEVLLVLAIIGVTAALTIPKLNADVEERKIVSALRKSYAELEPIYQTIVETYGKPSEWGITDNSTLTQRFAEYFADTAAISKNCGTGSGCFSGSSIDSSSDYRKFIMKDGSAVAIYIYNLSDFNKRMSEEIDENNRCKGEMGRIKVDVNGPFKGTNDYDDDIFVFNMCYVEGLKPESTSSISDYSANYGDSKFTEWVIKVGNRDYMKCNNLNWTSKRTCD